MTEGTQRFCDLCWARILAAGYTDKCDLCESCLRDVDAWDELAGDADLDVVLVDRLIV